MGFYFGWFWLPFGLFTMLAVYWNEHGRPQSWMPGMFVIFCWLGLGIFFSFVRILGRIWGKATRDGAGHQDGR